MGLNLHSLWRRFTGNRPRQVCALSFSSAFRPLLESLEDRTLLSQTPAPVYIPPKDGDSGIPLIRFQGTSATVELARGGETQIYSSPTAWNAVSGWAVSGGQGSFFSATDSANANELLFALADFNGDGNLDAVVSSPSGSYLTSSSGESGGHKPIIANLPVSSQSQVFLLATGDYNGDRRTDVILVSRAVDQPNQVRLQVFLGKGDGTLLSEVDLKAGVGVLSVSVGSFNSSSALTVGDINNDGATDVMLSHVDAAGTTINILMGNGNQSFQPSQDLAVAPGAFVLDISAEVGGIVVRAVPKGNTELLPESPPGNTPILPESDPSQAPGAAGGGMPSEGTIVESGPVLVHTSVPGTGLSVQVLVDLNTLPKGSADTSFLPAEVFWAQVISSGQKSEHAEGDARSPSSSTETRPVASAQSSVDGGAKSVAVLATTSASAVGAKSGASSSSKASDLAESVLEEAHDVLLRGGSPGNKAQQSQSQVFAVGPALAVAGAATVAAGSGSLENVGFVLSQQALGLENKTGFLLSGLDEQGDLGAGLFLRFQPATAADTQASAPPFSVLEIGKAVLQAMIIVKLTPGGSGPDKGGVPGIVSTTDSVLRAAEVVKETSMFLTRLMRGFFQRYLGREPEKGEEQGWVNMLMGGDKEENVLTAFLTTREFSQRAETLIEIGTPDEKYLQALYTLVLERSPTAAELGSWLQGTAGLDHQLAASALVKSAEFRSQVIEEIYLDAFQRDITPEELAQWVTTPFDLMNLRSTFASFQERSA